MGDPLQFRGGARAPARGRTMRFAITGSTGLVGTALTKYLRRNGHDVTRVVRSYSGLPQAERAIVWHPEDGVIDAAGLEGHDAVIHLAGESISGVWTPGKKRRIRDSRVEGTTLLATTLASLASPPRTLIAASSFDFYGDRPPSELLDENSSRGNTFLADVIGDFEQASRPASDAGIRVVHPRFGNVLSASGGMLGVLLPLYRLGLGTTFGSGRQYWPWIALADIPTAMIHVLERPELSGPVNFVAPEHVTNAQFTDAVAAAVGRPSIIRLPAFAVKLAPGEMSQELLLRSSRVVPRKLLESGYEFQYPTLGSALAWVVSG
ncbi:MAG TPA: TIGR01777 family oxidoreductase [Longimicrobiales bacterium]|nr:TIGR01777 family oxidoreductase [Longimicrobiales bacterium]